MLIVQHIWSRWTKASRGANSELRRPRLNEAYMLPEMPTCAVGLHEVSAVEADDFKLSVRFAAVEHDDWRKPVPHHEVALDWHLTDAGAAIALVPPAPQRRQTSWPAYLPTPLFMLAAGETARIEWNGRFRTSLLGSDRSTYYEQHVYWLAVGDWHARLFLDAKPRKRIDLTTQIY